MKHRVVLTLSILLTLLSCAERDAAPTIEGRWYSMLPSHPNWLYDFHNGLLTQSVTEFGAVVSTRTYPYAERGDTLIIGGDLSNPVRRWVLTFESAGIVAVEQLDVQFITLRYLKREATR